MWLGRVFFSWLRVSGDFWSLLRRVGCCPFGCHETIEASSGEATLASDGCTTFARPGGCLLGQGHWQVPSHPRLMLIFWVGWDDKFDEYLMNISVCYSRCFVSDETFWWNWIWSGGDVGYLGDISIGRRCWAPRLHTGVHSVFNIYLLIKRMINRSAWSCGWEACPQHGMTWKPVGHVKASRYSEEDTAVEPAPSQQNPLQLFGDVMRCLEFFRVQLVRGCWEISPNLSKNVLVRRWDLDSFAERNPKLEVGRYDMLQ